MSTPTSTRLPSIDRRQFVLAAAVTGSAVGLAGSWQSRQAFAQDATARVGIGEDGYRTDERANVGMYPLNTNIFESLVALTPDYQITPMLAESWEFVAPGTWKIALRKNVTFHDGTAFKADAVKFTFDRIASNGGGVMGIGPDSTVVIDDYTVEITPTYVNMRLMEQIGHPNSSIMPVGLNPAEKRIGTGPFREVEYVAADHYTVEANNDYWGEGKAKVGKIQFNFYPDPTARLLALQAGDVELITDVPRESASQIEAMGNTMLKGPVGAYEAMYIQIHGTGDYALGSDPVIREAIALAVNRDQVISSAWQGNADPGTTMIPPAMLGDSVSLVAAPVFDINQAKSVLEASGWVAGDGGMRAKDGKPLALTLINGFATADAHGSVPELLQAQLKEVGIDVKIVETPDTATYEQRLSVGEGDLWLEAGSQNDGNPAFLPALLFGSPEPDGDPESTMYGRAFAPGKAFDDAIARSNEALETPEVQKAAAEAMNIVINTDHVAIPLCGFYRIVGHTSAVQAFELHSSGVNQRWTSLAMGG